MSELATKSPAYEIDCFGYRRYKDEGQNLTVDKLPVFGWDAHEPVRKGEEDRTAYIQSFKDSTDWASILKRYEETGDASILTVLPGQYGDITGLPDNLIDAQHAAVEGQKVIDGLGIKDAGSLTDEELTKIISEKIAEALKAQQTPATQDKKGEAD